MTKEELKKEAEEGLDKRLGTYAYINKQNCYRNYVDGYIDGVEPREKRIEELIALINAERERQEKCDDVHLRTIADLEKENAELKRQLEMSNESLKTLIKEIKSDVNECFGFEYNVLVAKLLNKWEIKEK